MLTYLYLYGSNYSKYRSNSLSRCKNFTRQARYSSTNKQILPETFTLNSGWVTGFSDAEGSFNMSIFKSKTPAIAWTIEPGFIITLHIRD